MSVLNEGTVGTGDFERQVDSRPEGLLLVILEVRQTPVRVVLALVLGTHHVNVYGHVLVGQHARHRHVESFENTLLALQSQVVRPLRVT